MNGAQITKHFLQIDKTTAPHFRGCYDSFAAPVEHLIDLNQGNIFVFLYQRHWIGLVVFDKKSFLIDSLARDKYPRELTDLLDRWATPYEVVPPFRVQHPSSNTCAHYIFYFVGGLCRRKNANQLMRPFDRFDLISNDRFIRDWYRHHGD